MFRYGIPTAKHAVVTSAGEALVLLRSGTFGFPVVLKADGLAAGKGVVIADTLAAAETAAREMMVDRKFGAAGERLVIEEFMHGREASFFVLTDGTHARVLPSAEDHKRAFDGDQGPNTGGMGAFSPSPLVDDACAGRVLDTIVFPTLRAMAAEGRPFAGFLYCGLMLTAEGPKVVEFNARMGDPETQVVLPALDEPLLPHLQAAARGELTSGVFRTRPERFVGVVVASGGYPDRFESGKVIPGDRRGPGSRRARVPRRHRVAGRGHRLGGRPSPDRRRPRRRLRRRPRSCLPRRLVHHIRRRVLPPRHRCPGGRDIVGARNKEQGARPQAASREPQAVRLPCPRSAC